MRLLITSLLLAAAAASGLRPETFDPRPVTVRSTVADPAQYTAIYGGGGGTAFTIRCPAGSVMVGLKARSGSWLDQLQLKCARVQSNGTLSGIAYSEIAGGSGGLRHEDVQCPAGTVVGSMHLRYGTYVNRVVAHCYPWNPATRSFDPFDAKGFITAGNESGSNTDRANCAKPKQPVVGIRGREGWYVDAIGLICDEPVG